MISKSQLETLFNIEIKSLHSLGGGCIASAFFVVLSDNSKRFIKFYSKPGVADVEADGLKLIADTRTIRVPVVFDCRQGALMLEWIESKSAGSDFSELLGQQLAALHRSSADKYGLDYDNFIGDNIQVNQPVTSSWKEFYWEHRLKYQYRLAERNGYADARMLKAFQLLECKFDSVLAGSEEKPALIHGDLWGGNKITDEKGQPCLIDPAVYYAHREAELGMTHLFGGFSQRFYSAYDEAYPLRDGADYRLNIYKLYHVMNHLNLFGSSYYSQAINLINYYL